MLLYMCVADEDRGGEVTFQASIDHPKAVRHQLSIRQRNIILVGGMHPSHGPSLLCVDRQAGGT